MLTNINASKFSNSTNISNGTGDHCYLRGVGNRNKCHNNSSTKDEQVLKKLAEMNQNLVGETTHAVLTTTRSTTYTNKDLNPSYR